MSPLRPNNLETPQTRRDHSGSLDVKRQRKALFNNSANRSNCYNDLQPFIQLFLLRPNVISRGISWRHPPNQTINLNASGVEWRPGTKRRSSSNTPWRTRANSSPTHRFRYSPESCNLDNTMEKPARGGLEIWLAAVKYNIPWKWWGNNSQ